MNAINMVFGERLNFKKQMLHLANYPALELLQYIIITTSWVCNKQNKREIIYFMTSSDESN